MEPFSRWALHRKIIKQKCLPNTFGFLFVLGFAINKWEIRNVADCAEETCTLMQPYIQLHFRQHACVSVCVHIVQCVLIPTVGFVVKCLRVIDWTNLLNLNIYS